MELIVLGSNCTRSDYYRDMVQKIIEELELDGVVRKTIDIEEIESYGIRVGCSNSYCPGCNFLHKDNKSGKYTPALVIDGEVVFHSSFPKEEMFREKIRLLANI